MANDCPECMAASAALRNIADGLSRGAGGELGMLLGGPRGAVIGAQVAPHLVEKGAMYVAEKVKGKRSPKKRSPKQRARDRRQKTAMATTQERARKKNGEFKKGWSQSRLMSAMHKECDKLEKRGR